MEGFATLGAGTSGGGVPEPGDVARYKVIDAVTANPAHALQAHLLGTAPIVVELRTDVDLGALDNQDHPPLLSPELVHSRLGTIRVGSNKTLFSARGATLRHGTLDLDGSRNVILRNLRFRGLWEWDEATRGEYDRQGWDFVVLRGARNVWIDHCDFGKAYDGPLDVVRGSDLVTVSWTRFTGDLEGEVERQVAHLEALYQADAADLRIPRYRALRERWSVADIVGHEVPQQKGNLVGNGDDMGSTDEGRLNVTFHHDVYLGVRQRTPRMRFGNAHVYNVLVQGAGGRSRGAQTAVNSTTGAAVLVENSLFRDVETPLAFSTRGRIAQRGSVWEVAGRPRPFDADRLDPRDPDRLVFNPPRDFSWSDRRRLPYAYHLDAVSGLRDHLRHAGVIVPASAADEARLRRDLLRTSAAAEKAWSVRMAESVMKRTPNALLLDAVNGPRWEYTPGLVLKAMFDVWERTGDDRYWKYAEAYYDGMIDEEGQIEGYRPDEYNIDRINAGKPLFLLYRKTGREKYRKAVERLRQQLRDHPRTSEGGFWHKKRYPHQMWLDGLYMGAPFLAQYAREFGDAAALDEVVKQFVLMEKHSRDPKTGLLFHGWDESRQQKWAHPKTGRSPSFWGRAMGWYAMGLVETLDFVPAGHPGRGELIGILRRLAEAVVRFQDRRTGVWYQVVDQGGRAGNYREASVSTMLSFALLKGARLGYLDAKHGAAGERAYAGVLKEFIEVEPDGVVNIHRVCQVAGLGGDPEKERYRDGTFAYYVGEKIRSNDPKAVGPFIFASLEMEGSRNR